MPRIPLRLGLTGGIGSGKSTVGRLFKSLGAVLIDADAIARNCTAPGGVAVSAIRKTFGADFIASDGGLDRPKMRELVFSAVGSKQQLESLVHPCVQTEIKRQIQLAQLSDVGCVVLDIPLLVESRRWRAEVDKVIVVDCPESTQIQRVVARDGLDAGLVTRIMNAQASRVHRLSAADVVLFNDAIALQDLASTVAQIATQFGL